MEINAENPGYLYARVGIPSWIVGSERDTINGKEQKKATSHYLRVLIGEPH
jgi:hypothetical protein